MTSTCGSYHDHQVEHKVDHQIHSQGPESEKCKEIGSTLGANLYHFLPAFLLLRVFNFLFLLLGNSKMRNSRLEGIFIFLLFFSFMWSFMFDWFMDMLVQ